MHYIFMFKDPIKQAWTVSDCIKSLTYEAAKIWIQINKPRIVCTFFTEATARIKELIDSFQRKRPSRFNSVATTSSGTVTVLLPQPTTATATSSLSSGVSWLFYFLYFNYAY